MEVEGAKGGGGGQGGGEGGGVQQVVREVQAREEGKGGEAGWQGGQVAVREAQLRQAGGEGGEGGGEGGRQVSRWSHLLVLLPLVEAALVVRDFRQGVRKSFGALLLLENFTGIIFEG